MHCGMSKNTGSTDFTGKNFHHDPAEVRPARYAGHAEQAGTKVNKGKKL